MFAGPLLFLVMDVKNPHIGGVKKIRYTGGLNKILIIMISNIQFLRAFAAFAVVFYHTNYRIFGIHTEFHGVSLFFVISGFLMTYVSRKSADGFLMNRLTRVVPLYWIVTLCLLAILGSVHFLQEAFTHRHPIELFSFREVLNSLLFIPYTDKDGNMLPVLGVGWTLNFEVFFYLVFGLWLKVSKKYAPLLVAGTIILLNPTVQLIPNHSDILTFYADLPRIYFPLGILCFYVWQLIPEQLAQRHKGSIALSSCIMWLVYFTWNVAPDLLKTNSAWVDSGISLAFPSIIIFSALMLHSSGFRPKQKLLLLLGDASYALYLTHSMFIYLLHYLMLRWPVFNPSASWVEVTLILVITPTIAILIYRYIERPMLGVLRRRLERKESPALGQVT